VFSEQKKNAIMFAVFQRADPLSEVVHGALCWGGQTRPHTGSHEGENQSFLHLFFKHSSFPLNNLACSTDKYCKTAYVQCCRQSKGGAKDHLMCRIYHIIWQSCSALWNIHQTQTSISNGSHCHVEVDGVNYWEQLWHMLQLWILTFRKPFRSLSVSMLES